MKASVPAAAAGMIDVGGELTVARLGTARCGSLARASGVSRQTGTGQSG
jgi:hypothetical protein